MMMRTADLEEFKYLWVLVGKKCYDVFSYTYSTFKLLEEYVLRHFSTLLDC